VVEKFQIREDRLGITTWLHRLVNIKSSVLDCGLEAPQASGRQMKAGSTELLPKMD
jgi:hypothetical protein